MVGLMIAQVPVVAYAADTPASTPAPAADTIAPTAPSLSLVSAVQTRVDLSYAPSTDNVGVTGYNLSRNGVKIDTLNPGNTGYSDVNVAPATTYTYVLTAFDAAGNVSSASAGLDVSTPATVQASPPSPTPAPVAAPTTGSAAPTSTAASNAATPTGKVPQFAFNDAKGLWEPTITSSFSWDPTAALYVSPIYSYNNVTGWYHVIPNATPSDAISALTAHSDNPAGLLASILGLSDPSNSNTGANSINNASQSSRNSLLAKLLGNASVNNDINSSATTGDASVSANTIAGSATTGAAKVVVNLLNLLNSMWTWSSGGFNYFVHNIFGNQTGDINLTSADVNGGGGQVGSLGCPGELVANINTGASSINNASAKCSNDITVQNKPKGSITNNVDVLAHSGDANVSSNTKAGNATSGDARAELNIINLINSAIGGGQTFFGMFNIYGNLNGDILFPTLNLNGSLGSSPTGNAVSNSNTGANSRNTASTSNNNETDITNAPSAVFNNNIKTGAVSGDSTVSGNTNAGNASTGNSSTNNAEFNLFDTSIFGDNGVLVIINDMGHWVGRLMNLGVFGGSGSGLLTSNASVVQNTNTGPNSRNTASLSNSNDIDITNAPTGTINNNIRAGALSGNAAVTNNTNAGNATSGAATVSSNVANIFGSHLSFNKIFGILIINVFGTWFGDVGNNTAAGNAIGGKGGGPISALSQTSPSPSHSTNSANFSTIIAQTASQPTEGSTNFIASIPTLQSPANALASVHQTTTAAVKSDTSTPILLAISMLALLVAAGMAVMEKRSKNI